KGDGMFWRHVRLAWLAGILVAGAGISSRAAANHPAPCTPTISCVEWVPESYPCTRTVYRTEYKEEVYTAYRCETVPGTRTYCTPVYKRIPDVRTETRLVCVSIPTVEERTVMQKHVTCQPVTYTVRRCVDKGHWECREVPACEKKHRLRGRLKKLCRKDDCCEPCG